MKHKFGVGMKVVVTGILNEDYMQYEGTVAEVVDAFGNHVFGGDRISKGTYGVAFPRGKLFVSPSCLTLAAPLSRGDLDTKVSWFELNLATGYQRRPEDLT